jgi:hypothetical protein
MGMASLAAAIAILLVSAIGAVAGAESRLGPSVEVRAPANATAVSHSALSGIACTKATSCVGVGTYETRSRAGVPMIATTTAAGWTRALAPSLPADHAGAYSASGLAGVSCPSTRNCVAVGSYENRSRSVLPMLAVEAAGTWSTGFTIGLPAGAGGNQLAQLTSVSCVAVGSCTAAGAFTDQHGNPELMAASETTGSWGTATQVVLPAGAGTVPKALGSVGLAGIACPDAADCVAVGSFLDSDGAYVPLHVAETAGVWRTALRAPLPAGTPATGSAALDAVSCTATGDCVAVGYDTDAAGRTAPVIERESHGRWSHVVAIGFPEMTPTVTAGSLGGVACTARACTAVGRLEASDGTSAPAVLVDDAGRWQPLVRLGSLPAANRHPPASELAAISCPEAITCVSVGDLEAVSAQGTVTSSLAMATRITPVRPAVDPAPPSHVSALPGPGELKASWSAGGDGGSAISSFAATASPGHASCTSSTTSCVISGLHDGTRYTVVVTATNVHGTSRPSAPSPGAVPGTVPSAPTGLGSARSHDRAVLRWHASTASPGDPVTRYVATAVAAGASSRSCASATTTCELNGLTRGDAYTVWVVAYNAVGPSVRSAARRFTSL